MKAPQETSIEIKAPSGRTLWRIGNGGHIERSTDAGRTWNLQTSPIQEDWLAGTAVNDKICWLVGRNGAIARTLDGENWERIIPVLVSTATNGKVPDWTGVTARDAQNATITASTQVRFTTQDGGKTWRAQ